ncbi:M20 family metallopeptidase [Blastopirellula sp. JC732]|uniref:M20 family metallopeptidase n=1 Tax=Blastopirellula sediminis TaxID=2894196 RepID=A0A9X1SG48_9BACT|nr:M20 family metallopeptidase [Blastopirellula sediminis]MCC9608937.1 M20 family metallopeptidase [Blastopirellula sediminis]MCC9628286.1 M20 family metallopeptidase [Blastopirellula sediminis]
MKVELRKKPKFVGAEFFSDADPLEILQQLIAIPSVNPCGGEAAGPIFYEHGMTRWLIQFFTQLGTPYEVQEVADGRCNVIARLDFDPDAPTIMLEAHQDTVPVDGMTIAPFVPELKEGRLYGRGACDVKGGMAAMLAAFARLATERPAGCANVIMACTCDEEFSATGARHLGRSWHSAEPADSFLTGPPDFCVVAEPTDLNVIVAHRGVVRWKLQTLGLACHSSRPHEGRSAIYAMAEVIQALQKYAAELPQRVGVHPLCGAPTLSIGKIVGGTSVNIVPHECEIEIDRRTSPGERTDHVLEELEAYLRQETNVEFVMLPPWIEADSLADDQDPRWVDRLLQQIEAVSGPREKVGAWYCTDASSFAAAGAPSVVYGPGSIAQAHTADEWIEVEQLRQACETYYQFCTSPVVTEIPA